MLVRAYTVEWTEKETIDERTHRRKKIAAFDSYGAARAKAIEILKARTEGVYLHNHEEVHEVGADGMMYDHLRVYSWRNRYQVTIKYHPAKPAYKTIKFW